MKLDERLGEGQDKHWVPLWGAKFFFQRFYFNHILSIDYHFIAKYNKGQADKGSS
jgi:hypothetical protein